MEQHYFKDEEEKEYLISNDHENVREKGKLPN